MHILLGQQLLSEATALYTDYVFTSKCVGDGSPRRLCSGLSEEDSDLSEPPTGRLISRPALPRNR